MLYRFVDDVRRAIDFEDVYAGQACFLVGGAPSLKPLIPKLNASSAVKVVMNNTATVVKPTLWFGADKAKYYSDSILHDARFPKFAVYSRRDCDVLGRPWKSLPNTYFMWTREGIRNEHFFERSPYFSWDKNVFTLTLQALYSFGFRTIFCVGTDLRVSYQEPYVYPSSLTVDMAKYNQRTYDCVLGKLKVVLPHTNDLKIFSCGADSRLNALVDYIDFDDALKMVESDIPNVNTKDVAHPVMEKKGK